MVWDLPWSSTRRNLYQPSNRLALWPSPIMLDSTLGNSSSIMTTHKQHLGPTDRPHYGLDKRHHDTDRLGHCRGKIVFDKWSLGDYIIHLRNFLKRLNSYAPDYFGSPRIGCGQDYSHFSNDASYHSRDTHRFRQFLSGLPLFNRQTDSYFMSKCFCVQYFRNLG